MGRYYDVEIAKEYGIAAAVIYNSIKEIDDYNDDLPKEPINYFNISSVIAEFKEFELSEILRSIANLIDAGLLTINEGTMNLYSRG